MNIYGYVIAIAVMVLFSAYFSASETAFSTMNKTRMKTQAEKHRRAALALALGEQYDRLISTILIGNNIVNIAAASLGTVLFVKLLENNGATVSTAVITIAVLIFGEITPKTIAKEHPEGFAIFSAPFMRLLMYIFLPFGAHFSLWQSLVKKLFKSKDDRKMSQEELLTFVDEVQQDGSIDHNESQLLRNAIEFTDLRAEDILTHRVNLEAIPVDTEKEKIAEIFYESKYSRLLVYDEDIDHIVGVLHQKDLYHGAHVTDLPLSEIITTPIFVVKDVKISEMIRLLQASKSHVAVVVDEYGGTHGIVTMEDILEELVGEIYDEHDEVPEDMTEIDEDTDVVDGSMDLSDFIDHYGLEIESDAISLNGWVVELLEKIPDVGDTVTYENYEITVTEVESHCASKLRVHKLFSPKEDEE